MTPQQHTLKAERIEQSLRKLNPADYEALIEACMLAGTHWFNVALHKLELTHVNDDAIHAQYLSAAIRLKLELVSPSLLEALDEIESYRPRFVRGNAAGGESAAERCLKLLARVRGIARDTASFMKA